MKICNHCKTEKEDIEFGKHSTRADNKNPCCKVCVRKKNKVYRKIYPERVKNKFFKYTYGITIAEIEELSKSQNHQCAICYDDFSNSKCCVDHNHTTGKIRKLLCSRCNLGLGLFRDNSDILSQAAQYLRTFN